MDINEIQKDALKELGNIGASHAATTLSQMLMSPIEMTVPDVEIIGISKIGEYVGEDTAALVVFEIQGEVHGGGYIVLYVPKTSLLRLTNRMLGSNDEDREIDEMDESAINEIGNIMISAFLDGTAELLGIVMLPSPPALAIGMGHAAMESVVAQVAVTVDEVVLFKTELNSDEPTIYASLFMLPEPELLDEILSLLDKLVNGE